MFKADYGKPFTCWMSFSRSKYQLTHWLRATWYCIRGTGHRQCSCWLVPSLEPGHLRNHCKTRARWRNHSNHLQWTLKLLAAMSLLAEICQSSFLSTAMTHADIMFYYTAEHQPASLPWLLMTRLLVLALPKHNTGCLSPVEFIHILQDYFTGQGQSYEQQRWRIRVTVSN